MSKHDIVNFKKERCLVKIESAHRISSISSAFFDTIRTWKYFS